MGSRRALLTDRLPLPSQYEGNGPHARDPLVNGPNVVPYGSIANVLVTAEADFLVGIRVGDRPGP